MNIWVDADACPVVIKEILFKAAQRTAIPMTLVANQYIRIPASPFIKMLQVQAGFDVADHEIVKRCKHGDLVITSDIPLADEIIEKGGFALSPRGDFFTSENIKGRLNIRDFLDSMRASGINTGGPPTLGHNDRQKFANHLDRLLTRHAGNTK